MTRFQKKNMATQPSKTQETHDFDLLLLVIHGTNAAHYTDVGRGNLRLGKGMAVGERRDGMLGFPVEVWQGHSAIVSFTGSTLFL